MPSDHLSGLNTSYALQFSIGCRSQIVKLLNRGHLYVFARQSRNALLVYDEWSVHAVGKLFMQSYRRRSRFWVNESRNEHHRYPERNIINIYSNPLTFVLHKMYLFWAPF